MRQYLQFRRITERFHVDTPRGPDLKASHLRDRRARCRGQECPRSYDIRQLDTLTAPGSKVWAYTYDTGDRLTRVDIPNGMHTPNTRMLPRDVRTPSSSGSEREVEDFMLTRYACYLMPQSGDPRKERAGGESQHAAQHTKSESTST